MLYRTADRATTLAFDLVVDGDFVVPDGDVTFEVQDAAGTSLETGTVIPLPGQNRISVPISAATNLVTPPDRPYRAVMITYDVNGQERSQVEVYRLTPWALIPISMDEVRGVLSLSSSELPDRDIDLTHAYFDLQDRTGLSIPTVLAADAAQATAICQALRYHAALQVIDTLELRALHKEQGDNIAISRFAKIDFDALRARIRAAYKAALDEVLPSDPNVDYSFSITVRPSPDPVTGQ